MISFKTNYIVDKGVFSKEVYKDLVSKLKSIGNEMCILLFIVINKPERATNA